MNDDPLGFYPAGRRRKDQVKGGVQVAGNIDSRDAPQVGTHTDSSGHVVSPLRLPNQGKDRCFEVDVCPDECSRLNQQAAGFVVIRNLRGVGVVEQKFEMTVRETINASVGTPIAG